MVSLTRWDQICSKLSRLKGAVPGIALLLCWLPLASAHNGPPAPLLVGHMIGPYLVSVWADPEVGTGAFFIRLEPPPGAQVPGDITVHVGIQPVSGRLAEAHYPTWRQEVSGNVQYQAEVPFDAQELWRVRIIIHGSGGSGEATVDVQTIPPGLGHWDVLIYLFPFLAIGFVWLRAVLYGQKRRREMSRQ